MGIFSSLFKKKSNSKLKGIDVVKFEIRINSCSAENDVYQGNLTPDKVVIEHLIVMPNWVGNTNKEKRQVYARKKGGEELYNKVNQLFTDCKVYNWDGFHGTNPNVCDGSSMCFEAQLSNGENISASGSNSFPKGYGDLIRALDEILES